MFNNAQVLIPKYVFIEYDTDFKKLKKLETALKEKRFDTGYIASGCLDNDRISILYISETLDDDEFMAFVGEHLDLKQTSIIISTAPEERFEWLTNYSPDIGKYDVDIIEGYEENPGIPEHMRSYLTDWAYDIDGAITEEQLGQRLRELCRSDEPDTEELFCRVMISPLKKYISIHKWVYNGLWEKYIEKETA